MGGVKDSALDNVANFLLPWLSNSNRSFSELSIHHPRHCPLNQQSWVQRPDPFSHMDRHTVMKWRLHVHTHLHSQRGSCIRAQGFGCLILHTSLKKKTGRLAHLIKTCKQKTAAAGDRFSEKCHWSVWLIHESFFLWVNVFRNKKLILKV